MSNNEAISKHFCTCHDIDCPLHPNNHDKGCSLCINNNLKNGKIPTCIFKNVNKDISKVNDWSIKGFVSFYNENTNPKK